MRGRSFWVLTTAIFIGACGDGSTGPTSPPPNPDTDGDGIANVIDACPTTPETFNNWADDDGCPDNSLQLYEGVRADVEIQWAAQFQASGFVYRPITGFTGYSSSATSPCGQLGPFNAFYCGLNEAVYYHRPFLDQMLTQTGDGAPAYVIAHEVGHHISWLLGWFQLLQMGQITLKQIELQADCYAGAWVSSVANRGFLESGDIEEVVVTAINGGDPLQDWFNPNGHGTAAQRSSAVLLGLFQGAGACDARNFPAASITWLDRERLQANRLDQLVMAPAPR